MRQATAGSTERRRQALARLRRRRLLQRLGKQGAQEAFLPKVGQVVGGFTLEARLGAGSYGTVYRVRLGDGLYALKLLYLPHAGPWALRELEVLLRLHHAGLMRVEAHGHWCHHPEVGPLFLYIVMDYVPGLPLDEYVERHNPVARWAARAGLALAAQLSVAHGAGVVHRDIKDDNVVVGEDGRAVLVDYGVGTFPGALEVSGGLLPHIAPFRAPEAWRFHREAPWGERYEASARDDLWALGVLLYGLLTGTRPFHGEDPEELEAAVLHTRPVPPHERNPRVPPALSSVCLRMLEKEAGARYPDAEAVGAALEEALAGADASWEVPLCEAWGPGNATTRSEENVSVDPVRARARHRRVVAHERERPRRGKPAPPEAEAPVPPLGEEAPAGQEAVPAGETAVPPPKATAARAATGYARAWRGGWWVLGVGALLAAPHSPRAPPPVASVPALSATPASWVAWVLSGQEVASGWGPLEGGGGAAPSWATTPVPVARATLPEDLSVKTPPKDSSPQEKQRKQNPVLDAIAKALCTAAMGATAAGCPGAQVRDTPKPEACPAGSLEAMKQLGIRTGDMALSRFPGTDPGFVIVHEGPGARLELFERLGQLEAGTVLTGRLLFGERVAGRFTEARTPRGDSYRVCLEAWSAWQGVRVRGLPRQPDEGGPGTATVTTAPDVKAVERFE
jgi:serine/threonine-protein kinase